MLSFVISFARRIRAHNRPGHPGVPAWNQKLLALANRAHRESFWGVSTGQHKYRILEPWHPVSRAEDGASSTVALHWK